MIIAAQLIHFNFISLDSFLPHITPSLPKLQNNFVKKYQTIHSYIKNALTEEIKFEINSYIEQNSSLNKTANHFCDFQSIIEKAVNWREKKDDKDIKDNVLENKINQIYLLLECFIVIKDKKNFNQIYNLIKDFFDPFENIGLAFELCELIKWMIRPLTTQDNNIIEIKETNNDDKFNQCNDFNEFKQKIPDILQILNIG